MRGRSIARISAGNAGEARRGPVGPQRDGGRMTDGQLDGRTQRCEELSGKGKRCRTGFSRTRSMLGRVGSRYNVGHP